MTANIVHIDVAALDAWRKRLDAARGEAIDGILAFARECHEFQSDCERKQGGSVYSKSMKEWYGIKKDVASRWATVGAHEKKLLSRNSTLPPSMETLYHLCEVPDNVIAAKVTHKTTQKQARKLKAAHVAKATPKPKPPKPRGYAAVLNARFGGGTRKYNGIRNTQKARVEALPGFGRNVEPSQENAFCEAWLREFPESVEIERPTLSEKDERKVQRAIDAELAKVQKEVHQFVDRKVHEKIAAEREQMFERTQEAERRVDSYNIAIKKINQFMTIEEFRLILNCLHPDRAPEDRRERFEKAFGVMKRLDKYFPS